MRFVLILMMAVLANSKTTYDTMKKAIQESSQMDAQNPIASKRSGAALCASCPEVALAPNATCGTRWAPQYGPRDETGCVCLKNYQCCPSTCAIVQADACAESADNTTDNSTVIRGAGNFYTQPGLDCCECPTGICMPCPPPVSPGALACGKCYHYNGHHSQNNQTLCWESGCQRNAEIVYPDPGCDTRCQKRMSTKDDCDNDKLICIDKTTPLGCMPAKPSEKQCFYPPKKILQEKFYSSNGTCQKCWVWEVKRKPDACSQIFPLSESCPTGHKKTSGVTTCETPRDICMPCTTTKAVCTSCEKLVTVQDACGSPVQTCVKKECPSMVNWNGKKCSGPLQFRKDVCGCDTFQCSLTCSAAQCSRFQANGHTLLNKFGNSCYSATTTPGQGSAGRTSWDDQRKKCQNAGGDLASVETQAEWVHIFNELKRLSLTYYFWLGGYCTGGNNYKWLTGSVISNSNPAYYSGSPSTCSSANERHILTHNFPNNCQISNCWVSQRSDSNHAVCEYPC